MMMIMRHVIDRMLTKCIENIAVTLNCARAWCIVDGNRGADFPEST